MFTGAFFLTLLRAAKEIKDVIILKAYILSLVQNWQCITHVVVVLKAHGVALPGLSLSQEIPQIKGKFKLRDDRSSEVGPQLPSGHPL